MRVLVMGAGVIGVTAAYELARDGHQVTVVDRGGSAANGTSFANAGMVACGHAFAWASPRAPKMMIRSMLGVDQPIRFRPQWSPAQWSWTLAFLGQCKLELTRRNTSIKHRLCVYSQQTLQRVVAETGVEYDAARKGLLYFHRSEESLARGVANMRFLESLGQEIEVVDRDGVIALEPGLRHVSGKIAGGIYSKTDESGDARLFTQALASKCAELGVVFRMDETIEQLVASGSQLESVLTSKERLSADAYVLALGPHSAKLAKQVGVNIPVYPVKGYSVTFPIREGQVPSRGVVDEDNLLAVTPMGRRLRATSVAEIAGFDTGHKPSQFAPMIGKLRMLFPEAADYDKPTYWAGLRPMTPDGPPRIGRSPVEKLYVNTGQGHMGWTMACGSARILADTIGGRQPAIDTAGLGLRTTG
jgi:D-amino-acid dehydrogenase